MELGKLVQESRLLNSKIRAGGHDNVFLPQMIRSLEQIEQFSGQLAGKVAAIQADATKLENKAALFLGGKGFDLASIKNELRKIGTMSNTATTSNDGLLQNSGAFSFDVDAFLQNELEHSIVMTLNRIDSFVIKEADKIIEERRGARWDENKWPIIEDITGPNTTKLQFKVNGPKVSAYCKATREFNESRLSQLPKNIASLIEKELKQIDGFDPKVEMLMESWRAVQCIFKVQSKIFFSDADGDEQVFLSRPMTALPENKLTDEQLIEGSLEFLQTSFLEFVNRTLAQYPRDALLGGRPSNMERIRAFCDIKLKRLSPIELGMIEQLGGSSVWMIIFYLLRSGLRNEAVIFAESMENSISRVDKSFINILKSFVNGTNGSNEEIESGLRLEYAKLLEGPCDPYKLALYKIFGKCDLGRKTISEIIKTSEDYLWLQLHLITVTRSSSDGDRSKAASSYGIQDLQRTVTDFGSNHFDPKQSNPWHYFEILCLVGLFEKGVEYLYKTNNFLDAIHFAIFFVTLKSIELSSSKRDQMITTDGKVNFIQMISNFVRQMRNSSIGDIQDPLAYLFTLSIVGDKAHNDACNDLVSDFVTICGDYNLLFGDIRSDGSVKPGILARYSKILNLKNIDSLIVIAAEKSQKDGKLQEALQLFNLAKKYDSVIELLNQKLSKSFLLTSAATQLELEELGHVANSIISYYSSIGASVMTSVLGRTCVLLCKLVELRRAYDRERWLNSYEAICSLDSILPIPRQSSNSSVDISLITGLASSFNNNEWSDQITNLLPDLMLIVMKTLSQRYNELRNFVGIDPGRHRQIEIIKTIARSLVTFIGMLKIRFPQDVYNLLARLEITIL